MKNRLYIPVAALAVLILSLCSCSRDDSPSEESILVSFSHLTEYTTDGFFDYFGQKVGMDIPEEYRALFPDKNLCFDKIIYKSIGGNCSALAVYPKDEMPQGMLLGMHHTISRKDEAPSESFFAMEVFMAFLGYYVVIPDYIGFGESSDRTHPYLHVESTAKDAICAVKAFREYLLSEMDIAIGKSLYVSGYSQGGGNALGFQKVAERDEVDAIHIEKVYCGSGPYDLVSFFQDCLENDYSGFPYGVAMVSLGLDAGDGLDMDFSKIFTGELADHYDEWILSKNYASYEVDSFIGSYHLSDFMHPDFFSDGNSEIEKLKASLAENSLVDGWTPVAPVRMMCATADDYVPCLCSEIAYNAFMAKGCDVELKIQDGMSHIETIIPFILNEYMDLSHIIR